jgi:aminoglycoside phosphotransferase (APT) family kinase protein
LEPDGRPSLLDWDDAGPWNPAEELAAALVSWSTGPHGSPCEGSRWRWSRATVGPVAW